MQTEKGTVAILLDQLVQSKVMILFLVILLIGYFSQMSINLAWTFDYLFYSSTYFIICLSSIAFTTAIHEKGHIEKLKELGYKPTNFKVHRIGDVSFSIENMDQMSIDEAYQNASAPFLIPIAYFSEIVFLTVLIVVNIVSPFPLNLVLLCFTLSAIVGLIGSFCALSVIRQRKTSGICVRLARAVTSRGDIDEIVTWNKTRESPK